jgi:hypothetical protein
VPGPDSASMDSSFLQLLIIIILASHCLEDINVILLGCDTV